MKLASDTQAGHEVDQAGTDRRRGSIVPVPSDVLIPLCVVGGIGAAVTSGWSALLAMLFLAPVVFLWLLQSTIDIPRTGVRLFLARIGLLLLAAWPCAYVILKSGGE